MEALDLLKPPTPPEPLTWKQILGEDPYTDEEIWKDIDYAEESSEDERTPRRRGKKDDIAPASSVEEDDSYDPEACVASVDQDALSEVEGTQFWKVQGDEESGKVAITELQAIRETLFMLAGLQTSLYHVDKQQGSFRLNQRYIFSHALPRTIDHMLSQFADIGRQVLLLRLWTTRSSSLPLIQTFEAAVRAQLIDHDRRLARLQQRYLSADHPRAVSLLELHAEVPISVRTATPTLTAC